jgi:hypothetical protein
MCCLCGLMETGKSISLPDHSQCCSTIQPALFYFFLLINFSFFKKKKCVYFTKFEDFIAEALLVTAAIVAINELLKIANH